LEKSEIEQGYSLNLKNQLVSIFKDLRQKVLFFQTQFGPHNFRKCPRCSHVYSRNHCLLSSICGSGQSLEGTSTTDKIVFETFTFTLDHSEQQPLKIVDTHKQRNQPRTTRGPCGFQMVWEDLQPVSSTKLVQSSESHSLGSVVGVDTPKNPRGSEKRAKKITGCKIEFDQSRILFDRSEVNGETPAPQVVSSEPKENCPEVGGGEKPSFFSRVLEEMRSWIHYFWLIIH